MRTLFITTARFGLSAQALAESASSGDIHSIRLPVPGVPRHRFIER